MVDVGDLLGVAAFAGALRERGVSVGRHAVWRWVRGGKVDAVRIGGRWFVRASEVRRLVAVGLDGGTGAMGNGQGTGDNGEGKRFNHGGHGEHGGKRGRGNLRQDAAATGNVQRVTCNAAEPLVVAPGGVDVGAVRRARVRVGGRSGAEAFCLRHGL